MDLDFALLAPVPKRRLRHADQTRGFLDPKVVLKRLRHICARYQATKTLSNFAIIERGGSGPSEFLLPVPRPAQPLPFP